MQIGISGAFEPDWGDLATMEPAPLVTYIRVSTSGQGRSGLGIEAQRQTLAHFAGTEGIEVVREFVEVETGKRTDALDHLPTQGRLGCSTETQEPRGGGQAGPS
jgi:hypothetical protein